MTLEISDGDWAHGAEMTQTLEAHDLVGVLQGCLVHENNPLDMSVVLDAGRIRAGVQGRAHVVQQTLGIATADANHPRYDLITVDPTGTGNVETGTPRDPADGPPSAPDLPDGHVVCAVVTVEGGATEISNADIRDSRITIDEGSLARPPAFPDWGAVRGESVETAFSSLYDGGQTGWGTLETMDLGQLGSADGEHRGSVLTPTGTVLITPSPGAWTGSGPYTYHFFVVDLPSLKAREVATIESDVTRAWRSSPALLIDGRVLVPPEGDPDLLLYDPFTESLSRGPTVSSDEYIDVTSLPDGRAFLTPGDKDTDIGLFDPTDNSFTTGPDPTPNSSGGSTPFRSTAVMPDGRVAMVPDAADYVGLFDPADDSFTEGPTTAAFCLETFLGPTGRVLIVDSDSGNPRVGVLDWRDDSLTWIKDFSGDGVDKIYSANVVLPDGRVRLQGGDGNSNIANVYWDPRSDTVEVRDDWQLEGMALLPDGRFIGPSSAEPARAFLVNTRGQGGPGTEYLARHPTMTTTR